MIMTRDDIENVDTNGIINNVIDLTIYVMNNNYY